MSQLPETRKLPKEPEEHGYVPRTMTDKRNAKRTEINDLKTEEQQKAVVELNKSTR
jgi:hypothetical protein